MTQPDGIRKRKDSLSDDYDSDDSGKKDKEINDIVEDIEKDNVNENGQEAKLRRIRCAVRDWGESSSCHGIPHMAQANTKPGFFNPNVDQSDRIAANQEHVNRRVLAEYIRVVNLPNQERLEVKDQVKKFLEEVVKYSNPLDPYPLSWPTITGHDGEKCNFRAKMTNPFWLYFISEGKKRLMEYNRKNVAKVRVVRDQTIYLSDIENLSLYLRRKIINYFKNNGMAPPEVIVKNGYITISGGTLANDKRYRSTELAVLLGWEYSDWSGTAIYEMMTPTEKRQYKVSSHAKKSKNAMKRSLFNDGKLTWGSLKLLAERSEENACPDTAEELCAAIVWSIILAFCAVGFVYLFSDTLAQYLRFEKIVQLNLGLEESNFPSVTFCNTNPYKRSKIQMVPALQALMTVYEASADGSLT